MAHRRSSRAGGLCGLCLALALLAAPLPAAAQRLVVTYKPDIDVFSGSPFVTQAIDLAKGIVEWSDPAAMSGPLVITSDGRHLFYRLLATPTGPLQLFARDLTTHLTVPLPFDFEPRLAHPSRLAVFGLTAVHSTGLGTSAGTLAELDPTGLHTLGGCPAGTTVSFDLSGDATTLATLCESGDVVLLSVATGLTIRTLTSDPAARIASLMLNHDASALVVTRQHAGVTNEIARLDAVTGSASATTTMGPVNAFCSLGARSPERTLALVGCSWFQPPISIAGEARVIDIGSFTLGPALASLIPAAAVFSPDNRSVFLTSANRFGAGTLAQYDTATGAITASSGLITPGPFAAAFAPLAPTLGAAVTAGRLDLSWTLPAHSPAATRYVLEAGTAPGLADIGAVTVGPGQALSLPGVPPGRYVVRVRAGNATGIGAASNEVTVTVP